MGLALGGFHVGGLLMVPAMAWAVDPDADRFGWRATTAGIGLVILLLAFPISRLVRNRPEDYGQRPDGDTVAPAPVITDLTEASQSTPAERGFTWREAIRTRVFWLMSWGHACNAVVMTTVIVHLGLMLTDRGMSLQTVAWVSPKETLRGFF